MVKNSQESYKEDRMQPYSTEQSILEGDIEVKELFQYVQKNAKSYTHFIFPRPMSFAEDGPIDRIQTAFYKCGDWFLYIYYFFRTSNQLQTTYFNLYQTSENEGIIEIK